MSTMNLTVWIGKDKIDEHYKKQINICLKK